MTPQRNRVGIARGNLTLNGVLSIATCAIYTPSIGHGALTIHLMIGYKRKEMFINLKSLANLGSSPANHIFPSFL